MAEEDKPLSEKDRAELIHELRNVQAEKQALKHLLRKATDLVDNLVEHDCEEPHREKAKAEAERLRRATS
jgi:hypothetical protein